MDVDLPAVHGITATKLLRATASSCAVIILSLHDDPQTRVRTQAAGTIAFVSKHESPTVLLTAIRQATRSE